MADKNDNEEQEELTEEQKIALLEKKIGKNKIVLLVLALLLIIVISVSVTAFSLILAQQPEDQDAQKEVPKLEEISKLKRQLGEQSSKIAEISLNMSEIKGLLANSSSTVITSVLAEQEQSNQKFLLALRSGIYDLAHMVPGSRTWLELYSEQIDQSLEHSKAREKILEKLKTSEPVTNKDIFFDEDY